MGGAHTSLESCVYSQGYSNRATRSPQINRKDHMFKRLRRWFEHHHKWPLKQIGHALYWVRTHTYNRYHMVDCRSKQNEYEWGYKDLSELILFANMNILKAFVEIEADSIAWDSDPAHATARGEMEIIYQWWMKGRREAHDAYDALMTKAYGFADCTVFEPCEDNPLLATLRFTRRGDPLWEEDCENCHKAEEVLEKKDEEMMIRLIKIRGYLWS